MASIDSLSRALLGMAAILAAMGVAGFASHSFAYLLVLGLAVLFGAAAALSIFAAKGSRARGGLFAFIIALAIIATYLFVASGGGGPPGPKPGLVGLAAASVGRVRGRSK